jgi:hypothetical protein
MYERQHAVINASATKVKPTPKTADAAAAKTPGMNT